MDLKNEIAKILLLPLIIFVFFWWHENYKKKGEIPFREIKYLIEKEGDEELIDENSLKEAITKIKTGNTHIEKIKETLLLIKGVKDCMLSLNIEKVLTIKITAKTIFAKYKAKNVNENTYIDENFNLIEAQKKPRRKSILLVENTDLLEGNELKEYLKYIAILNKKSDNNTIYKYEIKEKKIFSYSSINNEKKENEFIKEEEKNF